MQASTVPAAPPQISVVIPSLNEEAAVGAVVDQAWQGIEAAGPREFGLEPFVSAYETVYRELLR